MSGQRYFSIEEIIALPLLSAPKISDDGQKVAYIQTAVHWDENKYIRHVSVYDRESNKVSPLTTGLMESFSPHWSPDSQALAFISQVGEGDKKKQQIFIKLAGDEELYQVSCSEDGVENFRWSPDGKGFYYIAPTIELESLKRRKEIYGDFEYVDKEYRRNGLYYLGLEEALERGRLPFEKPKDLRTGGKDEEKVKELAVLLSDANEQHVADFDISPDGAWVAYLAAPSTNPIDTDDMGLYLLEVSSRKVEKLDIPKSSEPVRFSPDGKKLCYTRHVGEGVWFNNQVIEIYDLEQRIIVQLPVEIDENVTPVRWTERGIFIEWMNRTNMYNGLLSESGELTLLVGGEDCFAYSASITADGKHMAYLKASSTEPAELYIDGERISQQWKVYANRLRSKKQVVRWQSEDGTEIEGVLSVPVDFDPAQKYPLLVIIHGGPTATSLAIPTISKIYPIEQFIEKGFIILEPNYRGSAGYGEAFRKLNYRDLGTGDYADVITGVDYLITQGYVDNDRVGVMGWSQGGYISAFCATYSDRFKAISVGAGISDWMTYYVNTDIHQFTRIYLGDNPWNDPLIYQKTSPMSYIKSACTPTLIQHGDQDKRVPVPNAFQLYQGLQDMGVPTELVLFKGMGHGPRTPGIARAIMKQNLIWFAHYLLGESMDGFYLND